MKIFKKLTIKNFMSIKTAEISLDKQGLVLVQGHNKDDAAFESNGAGKSSIFEAISWSIFEKTIRGLSGDEVVSKNVGKNCVVFLDFLDDSDNSEYRIARYRKHSEHKNSLLLFKNGKNITTKSSKDTNALIEQILQIDFLSFTNSILFGQGLVKMFSVATDREKKEILEKMLQMDEIQSCLEIAKSKLNQEKSRLSEIQSDVIRQESGKEETEKTLRQLKEEQLNQKQKYKNQIKELLEQVEQQELELEQQEESLKEEQSKLEELEQLKDKIQEKLTEKKKSENLLNSFKLKLSSFESQETKTTQEIQKAESEEDEIKNGKAKICKSCGQVIESKESANEAVKHIQDRRKQLLQTLSEIQKEITEAQKEVDKLQKSVDKYKKFEDSYDALRDELSQAQANIFSDERIKKSIVSNIERLKKSVQDFKEEMKKSYESIINQKEEELKTIESKIKELKLQKTEVETRAENLKFWVDAFGNAGIKSYLLDSVTPFLNNKANEYLSKLAGSTMRIEFSTQTRLANGELRDKFEIRLLNNVGGDSYESNSEGEKRRIDLAISLALQDLIRSRSNSKLNILLYDEIFDSLDSVGCENAIQLLTEMQDKVESIFVITHNDILKTYFDKYLIVTKEEGSTSVRKEG